METKELVKSEVEVAVQVNSKIKTKILLPIMMMES